MNGNEITKRLKAEGWRVKRVRVDHHMLEKEGHVVLVPVHAPLTLAKACWPTSSSKQV
ncbi:MAG: type II toxin-antitoxin system HicA family toxin [Betaproteobacteria bacterium]|nr:type II toxin-antitoxin system HicA family toxin [Betaproteobacteria bacterium]